MLARALIVAWLAAAIPPLAARSVEWGQGEAALWGAAHAAAPDKVRPAVNLANALMAEGRVERARWLYSDAWSAAARGGDREGQLVARANIIILESRVGRRDYGRAALSALIGDFPNMDPNLLAQLEAATREP